MQSLKNYWQKGIVRVVVKYGSLLHGRAKMTKKKRRFCSLICILRRNDQMIKIMFVCHGNICRSPMAEFIFKDLAKKQGAAGRFLIASSATSTEEIWNGVGNPVYPPAKAELERHGLSCTGKRAVQLQKSDYDKYDLFIGMDSANIRNMLRIFGGDPAEKVHKLMDYTSRGGDVADPWYSERFDVAYRDIFDGCTALLDAMLKQDKQLK